MQKTTISISQKVKEQIQEYGKKGETYDEILSKILNYVEKRKVEEILMDETNCLTLDEATEYLRKSYGESNNR